MRKFEGGSGRGGRGFGDRNYDNGPVTDKPVKVGEEYDVTVEAVGAKGDGIAKVNNFVVFVPQAQANSTVRVRVTAVHQRFATAELVQ